MSFAFPTDPSEGTYTGILHDEFVTTSNWWITPTGPTDIWTQGATAGDAWNANASSGSGISTPSGGAITINRGSGSTSSYWAYLRSWGKVPSNGAQMMWETPSAGYSIMYSSRRWFGLWGGGDWPSTAGNPRTLPEYVIINADNIYLKSVDSEEWSMALNSIPGKDGVPSQVRGLRLHDGNIHILKADGSIYATIAGWPTLTSSTLYPVFGAGGVGSATSSDDVRLSWVKIGAFSSVLHANVNAPTFTLDVSAPSAAPGISVRPESTVVDISTVDPAVLAVRNVSHTASPVAVDVTSPNVTIQTSATVSVSPVGINVDASGSIGYIDQNAYNVSVFSKGAETFYKGELNGQDAIGNANLTLEGVTYTEGITRGSSAFYFDGTGIGTSTPPIGESGPGYYDHTFEAWIKVTGVYNPEGSTHFWDEMGQIMKLTDTDVADGHMMMGVRSRNVGASPGGAEFHLDYGGANYPTPVLDDGQWHHLVMLRLDWGTGSAYIDGQWRGFFTSGNLSRRLDLDMLTIGDNVIGAIDNIAIYPRVLNQYEVYENYDLGLTEIASQIEHVYYTAEASTLDISVSDVTLTTLKSVAYPAQLISTDVNASGHGWHVQRTVAFEADPSIVNLISGDHVGAGNFVVTVNASPSTIELSAPVASVEAADSVSTTAESVVIDVTSLDARGGDPNKNMLFEAVNAIVLTPNGAYAVGGHDEYVSADVTDINVSTNEPSVSNMTDVLIQATQIGVKIKLVGFYNREEDKWADWIEATTSKEFGHDVWHRFHETEGTIAKDELTPVGGDSAASQGQYFGSPSFQVSGMLDDRVGVRLNGGADAIMGGTPTPLWGNGGFGGSGYSQELIFRTTDTGLLMGVSSAPLTAGIEVRDAGLRVFLGNAAEGWWTAAQFHYIDIPVKVNDGQWHQAIWFQEDPIGGTAANEVLRTWSLMIDGEVVTSRSPVGMMRNLGGADMRWIGGRGRVNPSATEHPEIAKIKSLSMDVMEFINRSWSGFSRDMGARSWRILAGHTIIDAGVANVNVDTTRGAVAKGNRKKMLLLYGIPEQSSWLDGDYFGYGRSSWSGAEAHNVAGIHWDAGANAYGNLYPRNGADGAGEWFGYSTYAVHYFDRREGTAKGILKGSTAGDDYYMDEETGDVRFIDINNDLAVDITEFDVIHVIKWPTSEGKDDDFFLPQFNTGENFFRAKDKFVESLRVAVDKGVGLWIADPRMAIDFGIAKVWDTHSHFVEVEEVRSNPSGPAARKSMELDQSFMPPGMGDKHPTTDSFFLAEREIVSTATDFSEFQATYYDRFYFGIDLYNPFRNHGQVFAAKVTHRADGLPIGSKMPMAASNRRLGGGAYVGGPQDTQRPISAVASLRKDGIVGQVIAKEDSFVWMGETLTPNPYADNVTTVLLEKGTLLNGRPLGGRIFVEVMDNGDNEVWIRAAHGGGSDNYFSMSHGSTTRIDGPRAKQYMNGQIVPESQRSRWDTDSRRVKETFMWFSQTDYSTATPKVTEIPYFEYGDIPPEDADVLVYPYVGMNARGLNWLGVKPEEEFGQAKVYPEAVKITVKANHPEVEVVRHAGFSAQAAEVRIEFRKPTGLADPDVTVNATPVRINVVGGTYQRIVSVGVATITVTGTSGEQITGSGEDHIVYLRNENITLYLGED